VERSVSGPSGESSLMAAPVRWGLDMNDYCSSKVNGYSMKRPVQTHLLQEQSDGGDLGVLA